MTKSSFGFDKPEHSPGFVLWQTTIIWQRLIKTALEPYNISHAQFVILAVLLWFDETKQTPIQAMLVNMTKLDKMTVSSALKKLTKEGFVKRKEHGQDTRAKSVCLTTKGKKLVKKLVPIIEEIDTNFFSALNNSDLKSLINSLHQLTC